MTTNLSLSTFSVLRLIRHIFFTDLLIKATDRDYIFTSYQMDNKTKTTERLFDILFIALMAVICFVLMTWA